MTTINSGAIGSQNILSNQKVVDMSDRIYLLEPQAAPLYVLVSRLNKRVAINTTVQWLEDVLNPSWTTLDATMACAATGTTMFLTASEGIFNMWDLVKVPVTGEIFLVLGFGTATTDVCAARMYQPAMAHSRLPVAVTTNNSAASGADLVIIGSAFAEGSASTDLATLSTQTTVVSNYLQIFRKSVEITKSMANTELYGGADRPYQRKKKGIELMRDLERAFLFGEPLQDTGAAGTYAYAQAGGHARRTTGGIEYFISTNATDAGGALTEPEFEGFLRSVFRYGSNTRYLFCAPLILSVISLWAQGKKLIALIKSSLINGRSLRWPSSASLNTAAETERDELDESSKRQSDLHESEHAVNIMKLQMFPKDKTSQTVGPCIKNLTKSVEVHNMDNTEERLLEKDLAWLAGILDGEGSFGIYDYGRKGIVVRLEIPNTDKSLVLKAKEISEKIIHHPIKLKERDPKSQLNIKTKKRQYSFQLSNMKLVNCLLNTIKEYLVSYKKQLANLICEYAELRKQRAYKSSLTEREKEILSHINKIRNDYTLEVRND
jgi:hypothetical protein